MNQLAQQLKRYYNHSSNKIVFKNNQSLNQLSLSLWEELDYHSIDASVLSKILKGERLFTFKQLQAFCTIINLSFKEKQELFNAWQQEIIKRKGQENLKSFFLSPNNEYLYHLIQHCFDQLYEGKCHLAYDNVEFLFQKTRNDEKVKGELKILLLYLQGRFFGSTATGTSVITKTSSIINQIKLIKVSDQDLKQGLINTLYANACYVSTKYSSNNQYLTKGINSSKQTLALNFPISEKLFAARTLLSLAIISHDQHFINSTKNTVKELLKQIENPQDFVSGYHLVSSIALSTADDDITKGFDLLQEYQQKFKINLFNKGNYSLSFIKTEIDLYLSAQENNQHLKNLIQKGLTLSQQLNISRYSRFFNHLSLTLN